ncbi:MAG: mandelate racemase/muconate lactonizing enzyme family protein [Dehalococcoidia bacterium]|nr:mandelate racemase/muconate lactonizing enzyme family protein [Dehalococcoidia bacterium]
MKVTGVSWTSFRLPLRAPFRTAAGEITCREGLILRLCTDAGVVGLGEASPHPTLEAEGLPEVEAALERLAPRLLGLRVECLEPSPGPGIPPALACALDVAACDALARARGLSVARLLSESVRASAPVNATIAAESDNEAATEAAAARAAGFGCVKLKVGMARSLEDERRKVAAVRAALGPEIALRLDVNGAWGAEQAVLAIRSLAEFGLELVEQPVAPGDLEGMARVRAACGVPIAADEDVTGAAAAARLLEGGAVDALVVKPMVVGGLRLAMQIAAMARTAGAAAIVTTTLDAGVGTAAALHLAAALPAKGPAHGLATGSLLAADVVARPLAVRAGRMALPEGPGLGVELDEGALARYGGVAREVRW